MSEERAIDGGLKKWWQYPSPNNLPLSDSANNEYHSGDPTSIGKCEECLIRIWDEDNYVEVEEDILYCSDCLESLGYFV